ncbi:MAG: hypothetical protein ACRC6A_07865 [Fusobacteriaceae bacterium]
MKFDIVKQSLSDKNKKFVEIIGYIISPLGIWIYPSINELLTDIIYNIFNRKEI